MCANQWFDLQNTIEGVMDDRRQKQEDQPGQQIKDKQLILFIIKTHTGYISINWLCNYITEFKRSLFLYFVYILGDFKIFFMWDKTGS